jgi:hypothetical protein
VLLLLLASAVLNLEGDPQPVEFLIVLSVNTRDPMPVEVVDWSLFLQEEIRTRNDNTQKSTESQY